MLECSEQLVQNIYFILEGVYLTIPCSVISMIFGLIIGLVIAVMRFQDHRILKYFTIIYVSIFRGTPVLLQLSVIYFILPGVGITISVFWSTVVAFSLNSGAYISEIVRSGINSVDKGQFDAIKALGIKFNSYMKDIILPQALRNVFPALVNEFSTLLKESALISVIGGMDIMRRAQMISAETYSYFEPLIIAGSIYYILILIITVFTKILEKLLIIK
ncbi:amino acid ABC transporter permease [Rickettsia endosymbiont of Cardiosporidium cionae]|uniref:amino acid ABC transporter permease n=1 Tax=Rickettsia endosymbiont of Cardiosporidium cionae TaxID=2777155 RepID=UPI00189471BF|nr:amino acid ABC transporter permease [Rickettsia endosymbiont of Cardiosporidium cionae]KAF8818942.1 amino acid ABC transporter permease [Rickettsia endosymbiont of Cardiosporidium cionae]